MDIVWIVFAFVCGLAVKLVGLPPLIGFLVAGFALNLAGMEPNASLSTLADLGITLMLFTIGLKLDVRDLLKREVWATTLSHMAVWTLVAGSLGLGIATVGLAYATGLDLRAAAVLAFALSFSSTVCIIKVLEDSGELATRHGRLSVGILVMQDLVAVGFLVIATGKLPSPWALSLLALLVLRPVLHLLLRHAGHGELLPLTGFLLAIGGYELFSALGVKGDLGPLVLGMLLSDHSKASELAKSLLHFKDLFLIGFFISIGLTTLPDLGMVLMALALCMLLPLKLGMFFALLAGLRLRARTAYLCALLLSNYSEFGLIVVSLCVGFGWLGNEWLVILALAVSFSFLLTSVAYRSAHGFYAHHRQQIRRFENAERLPEDQVYRPSTAEILVVGIGRVGRGAFNSLHRLVGDRVWGMDANRELIRNLQAEGLHVFAGDGENADVWEAVDPRSIRLVMLAVSSVEDCRNIAEQLRLANYTGPIAAIARYDDERPALLEAGIDHVFNFFTEAGVGLAEDSLQLIHEKSPLVPLPNARPEPG
jgi:glutathione-regulated potassium-efflux system ancillary protein KefC